MVLQFILKIVRLIALLKKMANKYMYPNAKSGFPRHPTFAVG